MLCQLFDTIKSKEVVNGDDLQALWKKAGKWTKAGKAPPALCKVFAGTIF
jgi:hypothetical protein